MTRNADSITTGAIITNGKFCHASLKDCEVDEGRNTGRDGGIKIWKGQGPSTLSPALATHLTRELLPSIEMTKRGEGGGGTWLITKWSKWTTKTPGWPWCLWGSNPFGPRTFVLEIAFENIFPLSRSRGCATRDSTTRLADGKTADVQPQDSASNGNIISDPHKLSAVVAIGYLCSVCLSTLNIPYVQHGSAVQGSRSLTVGHIITDKPINGP